MQSVPFYPDEREAAISQAKLWLRDNKDKIHESFSGEFVNDINVWAYHFGLDAAKALNDPTQVYPLRILAAAEAIEGVQTILQFLLAEALTDNENWSRADLSRLLGHAQANRFNKHFPAVEQIISELDSGKTTLDLGDGWSFTKSESTDD